jgi:hypothetical protein
MKMEQTEYSETSAYKIQTPGNYPEEKNIQLSSSSFLCVMSIQISDQNANVNSLFAGNYPSVVNIKLLLQVLPLGQKLRISNRLHR